MDSYSLLPGHNIKLEPACETEHVYSRAEDVLTGGQVFDMVDSKLPVSIKIEQPEVKLEYPDQDKRSMDSYSLLPSHKIKLEQTCNTGHIHSSAEEGIIEEEVVDMVDSKLPVSIKIEQPEVKLECPDQDKKIHPGSESYPSWLDQSQMEKAEYGEMDSKLVKPESPDVLFGIEDHRFNERMDMTSCCSSQEMSGDNAQSRIFEERITLTNHQIISLIKIDDDCTASQVKNSSCMLESRSSMVEMNTQSCLSNENCQLQDGKIPVEHIQVPLLSLDNSVGNTSHSSLRIQAGDTPSLSDDSDGTINVNRCLNRCKTTDTRGKKYKCDDCGALLTKIDQMNSHIVTHTGEKPYMCDDCDASFTHACSLKRHLKTHTREKPYMCNVCCVSFPFLANLKCHMTTHMEEKPYKCNDCGAYFIQANSLKRHIKIHTGEKPYKCDVCSTGFAESGHLKSHVRTHTGEKTYNCECCGVCFTEAWTLKLHMRTHIGEKSCKCDVCGAFFPVAGSLKKHNRAHTGGKPYNCDLCSTGFAKSWDLKCHMRIHTGEKPYKCYHCRASFSTASYLKRHMRRHTGEKPYQCDVCGKCFSESAHLKSHMRIHTRKKRYKCDVVWCIIHPC